MWKRFILNSASRTIALFLTMIAVLWPLTIILSYGLPPCESNGWLQVVSRIALPLAFAVAAWLMVRAANKSIWRDFFAACAIVLTALLTTWLTYWYDDHNQKACAKRSLSEAAKACKADPKYVKRSTDTHGNPTFTLVSPGNTDEVWQCLTNWSRHNGLVSPVRERRP